jgi:serpin B
MIRRPFLGSLAAPLAVLPLVFAGCGGAPSPEGGSGSPGSPAKGGPTGPVIASAGGERNLAPEASTSDVASLVRGNADFAFALYHGWTSAEPSNNLFFSPYSVSLALAMTYVGAQGETATQMAKALDFALPPASLSPTFDKLDLAIEAKPKDAAGANGTPFALTLADSLWGGQVSFGKSFIDTLAVDYGAALRTVDFAAEPAAAEADINACVSTETDGKINPLLGPGEITTLTEFVIVNAVYFNAAWATPFEKNATSPGTFTRSDGSTVEASLMRATTGVPSKYAKGANYEAVELEYSGKTTSMVIVLPDAGAFGAIEAGLSGAFFDAVTQELSPALVDVTMPKFKIHGPSVSLVSDLESLGMVDAFDASRADFTAMIPAGGVYISDVVHQAFVDVDESGTEAAAATAVVGTTDGVARAPTQIDVNRAFFFFIRDLATNTVIFVGRENDPTAL